MALSGNIDMTDDEAKLYRALNFDPKDYDDAETNRINIPILMERLLSRDAIPQIRLEYFNVEEYNTGRLKTSHRGLFERNGTFGEEIYMHFSFLKYLRYFVEGARLPDNVISEYHSEIKRREPVSPGDTSDLIAIAKSIVRREGLSPQEVAEEFFKLCIDSGVYLGHAKRVRDAIHRMR